jgi:hypothetical protein
VQFIHIVFSILTEYKNITFGSKITLHNLKIK